MTKGKVIWNVPDGQRRLQVTFILAGALPNHEYTVGAHFFGAGVDVNFGDGKNLVGGGATRDGVTADVDAWDFGVLMTDSEGDGAANFNLIPNSGTYHVQFTVRIGGAQDVPKQIALLYIAPALSTPLTQRRSSFPDSLLQKVRSLLGSAGLPVATMRPPSVAELVVTIGVLVEKPIPQGRAAHETGDTW